MSVISTEMYEALLLANVPADKAKAAAGEVAKTHDFVTKADLLEFGGQLQAEMERRFAEFDRRFAEFDRRFAEFEKRFAEFEKRFAAVDKSLAIVKFAVFSGGSIILALLIKLVFFP